MGSLQTESNECTINVKADLNDDAECRCRGFLYNVHTSTHTHARASMDDISKERKITYRLEPKTVELDQLSSGFGVLRVAMSQLLAVMSDDEISALRFAELSGNICDRSRDLT